MLDVPVTEQPTMIREMEYKGETITIPNKYKQLRLEVSGEPG